MNKAELIQALEPYDDDTEIVVWRWSNRYGSRLFCTNQILTNNMEDNLPQHRHPDYFGLSCEQSALYEPKHQ